MANLDENKIRVYQDQGSNLAALPSADLTLDSPRTMQFDSKSGLLYVSTEGQTASYIKIISITGAGADLKVDHSHGYFAGSAF